MKQFGATVREAADEQLDHVKERAGSKIKGDERQLQQQHQRAGNRNGKRADQFRRLVEACKRKQLETIGRLLVDQPELVNLHDKQHRNLLHYAAILVTGDDETKAPDSVRVQADSLDCFNYLASRCESRLWFQADQDGLSVLHLAVISGNNALVDEILFSRKRANHIELAPLILALDKEHHSALHWAVITNNLECVRLLIGHSGVQLVHQADLNGATPLHYATQISDYPKYRRQLRQMLKNATATSAEEARLNSASSASSSISCRDESADATRTRAAQSESKFASLYNHLDVLDFLVRLPGVNLECRDRDSRTPLLWAASSGNRQAILLLLQAGANYLSQDANNLGSLHCAASHGFTDCLECLLSVPMASSSRNQLINQVDHLSCTPLFYAALSGNVDCVELLLERGAQKDWQDVKGRTAAHFGALRGQLNTLKLLESHGANLWLANKQGDLPLHYAVKSGRQQVVAWLLERSPYERPVNAINNTGRAPIHLAVLKNNANMVDFLIRRGANLNQLVKIRDKSKQTPPDGVQLALVNSSSAHQTGPGSFHYETALDMATRLNQRQLVELLERNSAESAATVLAARQAGRTKPTASRDNVRSLFDLQAADVASPIGFETGGSSTEPPISDRRPSQAARVAWMPTLPRAMAEPMPQSSGDSANSSALSQSSLTSLNHGQARRDQETGAETGEQRDGQQQAARSRRPFEGGVNYNNDRISASIRCKLYENTAVSHHSFPPLSSPSERARLQPHKSADSLLENPGGHQQEIVTNVNVYTSSPCAQCIRSIGSGGARHSYSRKCSDCTKGATAGAQRLAQTQAHSKVSNRPMKKRLADGTISETSDSTSEVGNYEESEHDDELDLEAGRNEFRLPALSSFEESKRGHLMDVRQVSHAPTLRAFNQQLPVIMSAEEDRSTSGETGASQLAGKRANEEPRFDRSRRGRIPVRRSDRLREQARSPVADYIRSGEMGPNQRPVSEVRGQRVKQSAYVQPDYSQVRAKVDSHRNDSGLSSHFSDQLDGSSSLGGGRRSKSWSSSLAAQPDREQPVGAGRFSQSRARGLANGDEDQSRSCSRQTIIKTRRLSVDSDELATTIEKSIRRYKQEGKLFEELQNLKRSQIRSGRANECLLVKRLVEHFRHEALQEGLVGVDAYRGPYTYQAYELYLYDQLKKLSQFNNALLAGGRMPHKFTHQPQGGEPQHAAATSSPDRVDACFSQEEAHDFLDEDMKAEQELRRVLERGSMDSAAGHLSPTCDETIAIEPSGALDDIRVHQDEEVQQVDQTGSNAREHESDDSKVTENKPSDNEAEQRSEEMQIDCLREDLIRDRLERQARNSSAGSSRRSSVEVEQENLEKLPLWAAHSQSETKQAPDESERNQIEREASELTAAIMVDALGNVSRRGSPTGFKADWGASEAEPTDATGGDGLDQGEPQSEVGPPDRGRRRSVVNIGDKIEVIYHKVGIEIDTVAENDDQSDDSQEREQIQSTQDDGKEPVEAIRRSSVGEGHAQEEPSGSRESGTESVAKELNGETDSRSSLARMADSELLKQTNRSALRRASSPHTIGGSAKQLVESRRSSSPVNQTADAMATRRVFNGFDLDSLREHRRRHQPTSTEQSSSGPSRAQASKPAKRLRKPRSHFPAGPYKVYVPIELIRDRWNQVKRLERCRKNEMHLEERRQSKSGEAESRSLKVVDEMAHARSQPNLALGSSDEPVKQVDSTPDNCPNFILIYEVNKFARGVSSQPAEMREAAEPKPMSAGEKGGKQIIWCQKRMTRIVDVRTLKRTLSLPDSLIYSNELLKRFNLLKL